MRSKWQLIFKVGISRMLGAKAKIDVIVRETFVTDSTLKFFVNAAAPIADITTSPARMI